MSCRRRRRRKATYVDGDDPPEIGDAADAGPRTTTSIDS
jgi:hypothetical protein